MSILKHEFKPIYGLNKNGRILEWLASIYCTNENKIYYEIKYGQKDGKMQLSSKEYTVGKNIGKKNETTPYDQCFREVERKRKDKIEKEGYTENIDSLIEKEEKETETGKIFPMLAQTYSTTKSSKKDIIFPCYIQPKLDGLRCLSYVNKQTKLIMNQSRTGGIFEHLFHINSKLEQLFDKGDKEINFILDGELYNHDMPFENLAGIIKKKKLKSGDLEQICKVEYHIYDIIFLNDLDLSFEERYKKLKNMYDEKINSISTKIKLVETKECKSKDEFKSFFGEFIERGYEGIMLRNKNGKYVPNYRSSDLQKYKEFSENEYPICGFKEGEGRDKGCVIWICKDEKSGKEFSVRQRTTLEHRQKMFKEGEKYIGKLLTVIYQELSEYGIPRFPVGKDIREGY